MIEPSFTTTKNNFVLFFGGVFSQWYPSQFVIDGVTFADAEMYMMYKKAKLFNDHDTAAQILTVTHPRISKQLGRGVKGFDKAIWEANCKQFVYDGNYAKFTQNPDLLKYLLAVDYDQELVEASPTDTIWGIGLAEDDERAGNKELWQGTNWLGEALTKLMRNLKRPPQKAPIKFEDFEKLDIRICKILSVEKVKNTDKLYKMQIDTGFDQRTVISSIAQDFPIAQLLNQHLPFVLNLEPRKIKGIESNAMIILAKTVFSNKLFQISPLVYNDEITSENELTGATII